MALARISPLPINLEDAINFPSADGVNSVSLANGVAESITIPSGALLVRLVGTSDFYINPWATAAIPTDITNGTAAELVKASGGAEKWYSLKPDITALSVITSAASCIVTASFYIY